jgi:hypothetical protein
MTIFKGAAKGTYRGPCTFCGEYTETCVRQADLAGKKMAYCEKTDCRKKAGLWLLKQLKAAARRVGLK